MGKQSDIFRQGEGDAWFERNFYKIQDQEDADPVLPLLSRHIGGTYRALEFGCANGARLERLRTLRYIRWGYGVDASRAAIANGASRFRKLKLKQGLVADYRPRAKMNIIIYGFCLYVCDPEELSSIAAAGDRALLDGGHIIIHDFDGEYPHSVPNKHVEGLMTYKMDWSKLWLANPAYRLVEKVVIPDGTAVWLLKKDQKGAFPCQEQT